MNADGTFSSTRELQEYLLKPGNKIIKVVGYGFTRVVFYKDNGALNDSWSFSSPEHWRPYIEPKPKKKVYEWLVERPPRRARVWGDLLTEEEAAREFNDKVKLTKLREFEVEA